MRQWIESVMAGDTAGLAAATYRGATWPAACAYGLAVAARRAAYAAGLLKRERIPAPVISVGNITAGGTGKTPFVEWVCRRLIGAGRKPAIVSRGYGAGDAETNDEHRVLAANLPDVPHLLDACRVRGARAAIDKSGADSIILDDAFQHLAIHRDLDIVLVDATRPFGNGRLLPSGTLREPARQLRRAGAVVLTRTDAVSEDQLERVRHAVRPLARSALLAESLHAPTRLARLDGAPAESCEWLAGKRVFWFCGIGHPRAFVDTLASVGAEVAGGRAFPDHHAYSTADALAVADAAVAAGAEAIVTTQKDQVKLDFFREWPVTAFAIHVAIQVVEEEEALGRLIKEALGKGDGRAN